MTFFFFGIEQNKITDYLNNQRFEMSFWHKFSRYSINALHQVRIFLTVPTPSTLYQLAI